MLEIMKAEFWHLVRISKDLREYELSRIEDLKLNDAFNVISVGVWESEAQTALLDNRPICLWGIRQMSSMGETHLWMLATDEIYNYKLRFLREAKRFVEGASEKHGTIYSLVDSNFDKACDLIEWLGFFPVAIDKPYGTMKYEKRYGH